MPFLSTLLARLHALYLHVLDRTGGAEKLAALPLSAPVAARPLLALVAAAVGVALVYAALAAGRDVRVRTFRAAMLLSAAAAPLLYVRLGGTPVASALGGGLLAALVLAGLAHRALASRRTPGVAERVVARGRWALEAIGLALFAAGAVQLAAEGRVAVRLAFWALFLLRLSIADLVDPGRLAAESGLTASAAKDLRSAAGSAKARRRPTPSRRLHRGLVGLAKLGLLAAWVALPLAAAVARGKVAHREWPAETLHLTLYPTFALALTAFFLAARALRTFRTSALDAGRALAAAAATALWLVLAYRDPAFTAYRDSLAGLYLVETLAGFLLGAAQRR